MEQRKNRGKVIVVTNQKGGVGKTTITRNLGEGLYDNGYSVLMIDFDTQGSLSLACGIKGYKNLKHEQTIAYPFLNALRGGKGTFPILNLGQAAGKRLDLIPANKTLYAAAEAVREYPKEQKYRALGMIVANLKPYYDYIFIDTPPTLSEMLQNAIAGADECLLISSAESLSLDGIINSMETIRNMKSKTGNDVNVLGIIINDLTAKRAHQKHVTNQIKEYGKRDGIYVFNSMIPRATCVEEALSIGECVSSYKYSTDKAKTAFKELVEEFIGKVEEQF